MRTLRILEDSSFFAVVAVGLLLVSAASYADRALLPSAAHLTAENQEAIVTHEHDLQFKDASRSNGLLLVGKSTLRIVSKGDGAEILHERVMPLTALVNIDGGRYFAGLSTLQALAFRYNFLLVTQDGQVIATALITPTSGHCRSLSFTTANFIRWFDERDSDFVQLSIKDGHVEEIVVQNPYDRTADEQSGVCRIPVEVAAEL